MKSSLESLLAASLSDLQQISTHAEASDDSSPIETLNTITSEQINAEVLEHIKEERYQDEDGLRDYAEEYAEANQLDHAAMRAEIEDVRETVQVVAASMEMLSLMASMESIDGDTLVTANTTLSNIASQAGEPQAPVLLVEDGKITTASMEGLVDFIKNVMTKLKNWIKEKFENMAISMRRGNMYRQTLIKRVEALQARMNKLPEDYGIPAKALKYDINWILTLYEDGQPIPFNAKALKASSDEALKLMTFATSKMAEEAVKRSSAIGDVIAGVLVARDENAAEEQLRKLFKDVSGKLPVEDAVKYGSEKAGATFIDGGVNYRSRYRDAEWIMELVRLLEVNQLFVRYRRSGRMDIKVLDVAELRDILDVAINLMEDPVMTDYGYFNELSGAWHDANEVYGKLWTMVNSMQFAHMNNELWRAFDVSVSGMFILLDKTYYHIESLRAPSYRLLSGMLYVLEEQMKAYAAVNR